MKAEQKAYKRVARKAVMTVVQMVAWKDELKVAWWDPKRGC